MQPEIISTSWVLSCRVFDVQSCLIRENGNEYLRETILHPGSAVIVPVFEDGTVALVKQYRHAAGEYLLELPAGGIETGESAEECARREIREEIGYSAGKMEKLTEFYVSPGFLTEKMFVFLASDLTRDARPPDDDEFITVHRMELRSALDLISSNEIADAKTMLGLTFAAGRLRSCSQAPADA